MEALIGIVGADYVILAADRRAARSIVVMKSTLDKFRELSKSVVLSFSGEPGDATNFAEFVQANVRLYEMRNELPLGTHAASHYTRRLLADSLRSRVSACMRAVSSVLSYFLVPLERLPDECPHRRRLRGEG